MSGQNQNDEDQWGLEQPTLQAQPQPDSNQGVQTHLKDKWSDNTPHSSIVNEDRDSTPQHQDRKVVITKPLSPIPPPSSKDTESLVQQFDNKKREELKDSQKLQDVLSSPQSNSTKKPTQSMVVRERKKDVAAFAEKIERIVGHQFNFHGKPYYFDPKSLFILRGDSWLRQKLVQLITWKYFDGFVTCVIVANSIQLAFRDDMKRLEGDAYQSDTQDIVDMVGMCFSIFFMAECILKILAMGFFLHKTSYIRGDRWNWLDFFIVIVSIPDLFDSDKLGRFSSLKIIRTFRILRPLRSINKVKRMKFLINALLKSMPGVMNVVGFLVFVLSIFGIFGIHQFSGATYKRCRTLEEPQINDNWIMASAQQRLEQNINMFQPWPIDTNVKWLCQDDDSCKVLLKNTESKVFKCGTPRDFGLPVESDFVGTSDLIMYDIIGFENFPKAMLTIFVAVTLENWVFMMYNYYDASSPIISVCFFILLVVGGAFFALNLVLAQIMESFYAESKKQEAEDDAEKEEKKREKKDELQRQRSEDTHRYLHQRKVDMQNGEETERVGDIELSRVQNPSVINVDERKSQLKMDKVLMISSEEGEGERRGSHHSSVPATLRPADDLNQTSKILEDDQELSAECDEEEVYDRDARLRAETNGCIKCFYTIVTNTWFNFFIFLLIIANTIALSEEDTFNSAEKLEVLHRLNDIISAIFIIEMVFKLIGLGPSNYFKDNFNRFDACVVLLSLVDFALAYSGVQADAIQALKALRLLRAIKLARLWPALQVILTKTGKAFNDISYFGVLLFLFMYTMGLLGMEIFAHYCQFDENDGSLVQDVKVAYKNRADRPIAPPRANFDSIGEALTSIFIIIVGEDWPKIMFNYTRVFGDNSYLVTIYFICVYSIGNYMLLSLFTAILLQNFEPEEEDERSISDIKRGSTKTNFSTTLRSGQSCSQTCTDFCNEAKYQFIVAFGTYKNILKARQIRDDVFNNPYGSGVKEGQVLPHNENDSMKDESSDSGSSDDDQGKIISQNTPSSIYNGPAIQVQNSDQGAISPSVDTASRIQSAPRNKKVKPLPDAAKTDTDFQAQAPVVKDKDGSIENDFESANVNGRLDSPRSQNKNQQIMTPSRISDDDPKKANSLPFPSKQTIISPKNTNAAYNTDTKTPDQVTQRTPKQSSKYASPEKEHLFKGMGNSQMIHLQDQLNSDFLQTSAGQKNQISRKKHLHGNSLYCFSKFNRFRMACFKLMHASEFDTAILVFISLSTVLLATETPMENKNSQWYNIRKKIDYGMTAIFFTEMMIKITALGFVLNGKHSYLKDGWCCIDFTIVVSSLFSIVFAEYDISLSFLKAIRIVRILRPLRMISHIRGLQVSIMSLINSIPDIFNLLVIVIFFIFLLSILGTTLFGGRFYRCKDAHIFDDWRMDSKAIANKQDCLNHGGDWHNPDLNFDTTFDSFITLFTIQSTEGWVDVMWDSVDAVGPGLSPIQNTNRYYIVVYFFLVVILCMLFLNLFVGVVIFTFNKETNLLTLNYLLHADMEQWIQVQLMAYSAKPVIKLRADDVKVTFWLRKICINITNSPIFENGIVICILINTIVLACSWYGQERALAKIFEDCNLVLMVIFTMECLIKLIALKCAYFRDGWNQFDFCVVVGSNVATIMSFVDSGTSGAGGQAVVARIVRVLRVLRIIKRADKLQIIFETIVMALPAMGSLGALLLLFVFLFTIIGMQCFGEVKLQSELTDHANFQTFVNAFLLLMRCVTGEGWNFIMFDCGRQKQISFQCEETSQTYKEYIDNGEVMNGCGNMSVAIGYFFLFQVVVSQVFLNLFIAIVVDTFIGRSKQHKLPVSQLDIDTFVDIWATYDREGTGYIERDDLENIFIDLYNKDCSFFNEDPEEILTHEARVRIIINLELPMHDNFTRFMFYDVLMTVCRYTTQRVILRDEHELLKKTVVATLMWKQGQAPTDHQVRKEVDKQLPIQAAKKLSQMFNTQGADQRIELVHDITKRAKKIGKNTMVKLDRVMKSPNQKATSDPNHEIYTSKHVFLALRVADQWLKNKSRANAQTIQQ